MTIDDIIKEYTQPQHDGYGLVALSINSANKAKDFLKRYPALPQPELSVEPNGRLGMEWIGKSGRIALAFNPVWGCTYGGTYKGNGFCGKNIIGALWHIKRITKQYI